MNVCQNLQALSRGRQRMYSPQHQLNHPSHPLPSPTPHHLNYPSHPPPSPSTSPLNHPSHPPPPSTCSIPSHTSPASGHILPQRSEVAGQDLLQTAGLTAGTPPGESSGEDPCIHNRHRTLTPHPHTHIDAQLCVVGATHSLVVRTGMVSSDCGWS